MQPRPRAAWDPLAVAAAAVPVLLAILYVVIQARQGDSPAPWFLIGLALVAALIGYGADHGARGRVPCLVVGGVILIAFGVLAILSIGLPLLVGGVLALVAAVRSPGRGRALR
jgi:hypothetical protein